MQPSRSWNTIEEEPDDVDEVDSQLQSTPELEGDSRNGETDVVSTIEEMKNVDEVNTSELEDSGKSGQVNTKTISHLKEQFIGDNIDLNIVSINGNKPFHTMGWLKVGPRRINNENLNHQVPRIRLTPSEKENNIAYCCTHE